MIESKVDKKRGRPKAELKLTVAQRQAQTRARAHSALLTVEHNSAKELISKMSTSNLISALPKLIAGKYKELLTLVCDELVKRVNS